MIVGSQGNFTDAGIAQIQRTVLAVICLCILIGILVAGLWPFHAPANQVSWGSQGNGLRFGQHGSVVSVGPLGTSQSRAENACSIEIWVQPKRVDSGGTILAFYRPNRRVIPFSLLQYVSGLELKQEDQSGRKSRIYVDGIFSRPQPVFLSISSGKNGTAIYVDGALVEKSENFEFSSQDLSGEFILGNAPSSSNNWSGQVKGLAVYDHELTATEVSKHFTSWTKSRQPDLEKTEGLIAGYLFDEGKGSIVPNRVNSSANIVIPKRYFVIHEQFLEQSWYEFHSSWSYWQDVGINIAGFIPFGFFFHAYFSVVGKFRRVSLFTIALGFAVSLTIELLQGFLPTRDSSMTDLCTNTLGTVLGALFCAWSIKFNWLARTGNVIWSKRFFARSGYRP